MHTLIIAEAGVNHNGRLDLAIELCDAAKEAGADVVKFQTWITEKIITCNVEQAEYQKNNTGSNQSQFDMLKGLELSYEDFTKVKEHCDRIGIQFASTADEEDSLDFLINLGIPFIKIGSGDIGNISYLRTIGSKHMPVILSTGMSTIEDVRLSVEALRQGGASEISLLHCTTNYPCPYESVNLAAMDTLRKEFNLTVGYSDHTMGIAVPIAAVARGASIIEKHFTLDRSMEGPDQIASTEPEEFRKMVDSIRQIETAIGDGIKKPTDSEVEISKVVLKRIVAKRPIKKGAVITQDDICVKRNDTGYAARDWDKVVGAVASCDANIDEAVEID